LDVGKRMVHDRSGSAEVLRILDHLNENRSATDDQLEIVGERWLVKSLARRHIIRKVTG